MRTTKTVYVGNFGMVDIDYQEDGEFWDLFDSNGGCLNEGNPFWTEPTDEEVNHFICANYLTLPQ